MAVALGLVVEHRRGDVAGRYRVDPHAVLGQLQGQGLAQHHQCRLARAVGRRAAVGLAPGIAGDIDDAAAALLEVGDGRLADVERGLQVDPHDQVEVVFAERFHRPLAPDPGGIHHGIQAAGADQHLGQQLAAVTRTAQVGGGAEIQRHRGIQRVQAALVDVGGGDPPAALREALGDGAAEAASGAGDQDNGGAHGRFLQGRWSIR
ncbi:hypothetical protein D3C80_1444080 [compost metagenome]